MRARELADHVTSGRATVDAPYQRGPVWTTEQQVNLVRSWLLGPPHPDDRQHEWAVVDGKQRQLAAAAWLSGDRPVPASWFSPDLVERTVDTVDTDDGPYVTYQGLSDLRLRDTAARFTLPGAEAAVNTVAEEAMTYGLVNGAGVAQTDQDLARAARVAGEA